MTQLTNRITTLVAAIVLATTLLASGANAAVPASDGVPIAAVPAEAARTASVDGRPERDGDHHRRFCVRLNALLSRLVDNGVITREQKLHIMEAFNCVPEDRPSTERPATTRPNAVRPVAAQ